ncbi:MAG TPA: hypothetical protein PKU80_06410 [Candidatus Limiplasma sp.]|nr:hypothetical protein [Candidatus Limiplasma sp.]
MKRAFYIALLFVFAMSLSTVAVAEDTQNNTAFDRAYFTADMVGNAVERIDELTLEGHTCYMYVPASNRVGTMLAFAPMMMVFGDEAYTAESALATAHDKGFSAIAERDGACILFVNPLESWDSEADALNAQALYLSFYTIYSSNPLLVFENGTATKVNAETGEESTVYPGSLFGVQLIGEGKGADFIAANYLKSLPFVTNYGPQEGLAGEAPVCGVALFSPTAVPMKAEDGVALPLAIVNGPADADAVAASYSDSMVECMVATNADVDGFDADLLLTVYDTVVNKYHFAITMYYESPQYTINGIIDVNGKTTLSSGKVMESYAYLPEGLSYGEEHSIPLVLYFHGWGGEGEAMLSWTNWPQVGKDNGFVVISVDQHGDSTSDETIEWLGMLLEKYSFLDPSRVYATGFSMGSSKSWNLGLKNATTFAGIMPTSLGVFPEGETDLMTYVQDGVILPVFYIGGGLSPLPELPAAEANIVNNSFAVVWQMNSLGDYAFDEATGSRWGVNADSQRIIPSRDKNTEQVLVVDSFASADGNTYTWLSVNLNLAHDSCRNDSAVMWSYMSQFSRNADGTLSIGK